MGNNKVFEKFVRCTLGIFLLFVAVNAFVRGYYGMSGAKNVPKEWLKGSPFHNYFVPSLILCVCVGGCGLFAAIAVFRRYSIARKAAFISGIIILLWLTVQVSIIAMFHGAANYSSCGCYHSFSNLATSKI